MQRRTMGGMIRVLVVLTTLSAASGDDCPWPRADPELAPLYAACLCSINANNEFSVQCTSVDFPLLMGSLHGKAKSMNYDLLYVNNTKVSYLSDKAFLGLRIRNLQLSFCEISNVSEKAFEGLENIMENLNLQDNLLHEIPRVPLVSLKKLNLLDLSGNKFRRVPDSTFLGSKISTLKISRNAISLAPDAFKGLEASLKNLNMKGCQLKQVPLAVKRLKSLAFLDLAQNDIRVLDPGILEPLLSLTALNLERNLLQELSPGVFRGVADTLSSLSLLNNLLTKFPLEAINSLPQLRVLDIGFNLITNLPENAFYNVRALTLLAVDGNPLPTVSENAFQHLNGTLRGLSLGGHYFNCDCEIIWIVKWIRDFDLQVTSRDRDPQFCGKPQSLRPKSFYQLEVKDLVCDGKTASQKNAGVVPPKSPEEKLRPGTVEEVLEGKPGIAIPANDVPSIPDNPEKYPPLKTPRPPLNEGSQPRDKLSPEPPKKISTTEAISTYKPPLPPPPKPTPATIPPKKRPPKGEAKPEIRKPSYKQPVEEYKPPYEEKEEEQESNFTEREKNGAMVRGHSYSNDPYSNPRVPNIVRRPSDRTRTPEEFISSSKEDIFGDEVIVQDAFWDSNAINIQWDSETSNILGFRVVYRLFGDKYFKMGQPLAPSAREFKIKNVPANEYFVACVVSLEEMDVRLENVPFGQCREIRTGDANSKLSTHMDKIIIAASASICATVIVAVVIFICCYRGKSKEDNEKQGVPAVLNPSSPPLASLGALGNSKSTDWDTISMYSQRSIPRARMYHMDKEDTRSHISQMSSKSRPRSLADGQSQRSFSGMSGVHMPSAGPHFASPLSLSRPDLRLSRQSLPHSQYGSGYPHFAAGGIISRATSQRSERRRSYRTKTRERTSSRLSNAGSSHSLTGYDTDGWTDHDMDIYMARNPTRGGGLVQL